MFDFIQSGDIGGLMAYASVRIGITLGCWLFVVVACLVDMWSGVSTARAIHEPLMSHGFRRTITKIGDYWRVLLFALMFDILMALITFYYLPFLTLAGTLAIIIIEARSVIENSARKKSAAAQLPVVLDKIVGAATTDDARKIYKDIVQLYNSSNKHNGTQREIDSVD